MEKNELKELRIQSQNYLEQIQKKEVVIEHLEKWPCVLDYKNYPDSWNSFISYCSATYFRALLEHRNVPIKVEYYGSLSVEEAEELGKQKYSFWKKLPWVKRYDTISKELRTANANYKQVKARINRFCEKDCPHPLWYLLKSNWEDFIKWDSSDETMKFEHKCVRCGKIEKGFADYEERKIMLAKELYIKGTLEPFTTTTHYNKILDEFLIEDYEKIRDEFLELESEGYTLEEISKILYSKYTERDKEKAQMLEFKYKQN